MLSRDYQIYHQAGLRPTPLDGQKHTAICNSVAYQALISLQLPGNASTLSIGRVGKKLDGGSTVWSKMVPIDGSNHRKIPTLRPLRGTGPLAKEQGVWVFRTGLLISVSATDEMLEQVRRERDHGNLGKGE